MRPEDITEQDENGKIKDTEGQLAADENRNETVETEVSQEIHSEYKIPGKSESRVSYHLSGMYQDWFLDYASYVILERAVPHINAVGRRTLQQGGEYCRTYHAIPSARRCFYR